jgi:hypothetical protein
MNASASAPSRPCPDQDPAAAVETRSLDELADEIAELSAHIDAATWRLLKAISEFDRREGWAGGFLSCAHWLSWRAGMDLVTAREKVRVAHALERLPRISEAFRQGRVSYAKVRAMVRVATERNEEDLLNIALSGTASHVEKLVRGYRRAIRLEEQGEAGRQRRERYLDWYTDEDGMLVIRGRLPAEVGACVIKALEAAVDALRERAASGGDDSAESSGVQGPGSAGGRAEDAPGKGGDRLAGQDCLPVEGDRGRARWHDSARKEHDSAESSDAETTLGQLRADALGLIAERALSCGLGSEIRNDSYQVVVHVDSRVLAEPSAEGLCELEDGRRIAADTARRLSCDASMLGVLHGADGEALYVGRRSRKVTVPLWRALLSRDRKCRFPGCGRTRHLVVHHIRHWAEGGPTDPGNLVLLCRAHHWAVHEGGCSVEGRAPRELVFRRPDGTVVGECGVPTRVHGDPVALLRRRHRELGLEIDAETNRPYWCGETMDYELAVAGLLAADDCGERGGGSVLGG